MVNPVFGSVFFSDRFVFMLVLFLSFLVLYSMQGHALIFAVLNSFMFANQHHRSFTIYFTSTKLTNTETKKS